MTGAPHTVMVNGKAVSGWKFDGKAHTVSVNIPRVEGAMTIEVQ